MKNILWSFLIGGILIGGVVSSAMIQDVEFDAALSRGFEAEMTVYNTQEDYRPFDTLTREQGAKMFAVFAMKNLCIVPDESIVCEFSDASLADPTLLPFLTTACQLGLFQGFEGKFMPQQPLTKAQALTVLSRAIDGKQDETQNPRWSIYFEKARQHGLTKETDVRNLDKPLSRYESLLIQYRAKADDCGGVGYSDDLLKALSELFGEDVVPMTETWSSSTGDDSSDEMEDEEELTCSNTCSSTWFVVTTADKDGTHPAQQGSSVGYVIDGVQWALLTLQRGQTYTFDVDVDALHAFYISTDPVGIGDGIYVDGVSNNMVVSGSLTRTVSADAPDLLYYQCVNHPSMWRQIEIVDSCECES